MSNFRGAPHGEKSACALRSARSGRIFWAMVLGEAGAMLAIGLFIGVTLALAVGKTATAMLFNVKPYDPLTIALSATALAAVAILSSYLPARRAARRSIPWPPCATNKILRLGRCARFQGTLTAWH